MSIITDIFDKLPKNDAQMWMEARAHAEEYAEQRYYQGLEEGRREGEANRLDLLDRFCRYAEKHGYMDSDWYAEKPTLINQFIEEVNP